MTIRPRINLEWISLVYLALFVFAVLSPSLITRGIFGIHEVHIEEILIFAFGITGLAIFTIYQRLMERKEQEHQDAKDAHERAKRELVESYQYIGSMNRQIEVLKGLVNQTSLSIVDSRRLGKDILSSLLANAASSVNAQVAAIRYVELEKLRTIHETAHAPHGTPALKISNKELKRIHDMGAAHAFIATEDGQEILVVPSDRKGTAEKAYLIVVTDASSMPHIDSSLLKVFANQAELLRFMVHEEHLTNEEPLSLIDRARRSVIGNIS